MPVIRTYRCDACGDVFEVTHASSAEPSPPCPYCEKVLEWQPTRVNIGTTKGKAVDVTQKILEEDYGLTDFNDNLREGDVAGKAPVMTTAKREEIERLENDARLMAARAEPDAGAAAAAAKFFGGGQLNGGQRQQFQQWALASAKGAVPADRNPMDLLSKAGKAGQLPTGFKVIARA